MTSERPYPPKLVRDLMTVGVFTCHLNTPVEELIAAMLDGPHEGAAVLDSEGHAVGVVTINEMVKVYGIGAYQDQTAEDIMRPDVPQVPPDITLNAAAQIMQDMDTRIAYIMHNAGGIGYPAAVLTFDHFLRHMISKEQGDLVDLGVSAPRENPLDVFIKRREEARRKNLDKE